MKRHTLLCLLLIWGLFAPGLVQAAGLEVGQPFPALTLPSLRDGRPLSIADFRGEKLILHIWASW